MSSTTVKIKFDNTANPNSAFDLLKLEDFFRRSDFEHNPELHHKVEFFMLIFITEGEGIHTIDFTDYKVEKGTLLTIRKDQIHKFCKSKSIKGFLLLFTDEFLVSYLEKLEGEKSLQLFNELLADPTLHLVAQDFNTVVSIIDRIESEYLKLMDDFSLGIIRSELHILITKLFRLKSKNNQITFKRKYLSEFIHFQKIVEENVTKTNRVADYAHMLGVSTKTLNTVSKSIVNKTAKEFIYEISIKQIKRLLINTSLTIKEIAYESGFEEATNFYKYFKRQVEKTPEQFREEF